MGLRRIQIKTPSTGYPEDDVRRIQLALEVGGFAAHPQQCIVLWERYSESFCAGWLCLPEKDEEILEAVRKYFEPCTEE